MFDFAVKGTVTGFNTTKDGTRAFIKVLPSQTPPNLERDERACPLIIFLPSSLQKSFQMNTLVAVRGKAAIFEKAKREKRDEYWTNYRYEAESVEAVKTV